MNKVKENHRKVMQKLSERKGLLIQLQAQDGEDLDYKEGYDDGEGPKK